MLAELDYDNAEKCFYTRGDELISQERDGKKSYYVYDGHGSVRALADESGKVTDKYVYDAFGNLISSVGSTKNDFLFAGEQFDPVTGLYYLRARYMDPSVGTFISMDSYAGSIDDPVSLHKYLYANANPVSNSDPSGYFTLADISITNFINDQLEQIHNNSALWILKSLNFGFTVTDTLYCMQNAENWEEFFFYLGTGILSGVLNAKVFNKMCEIKKLEGCLCAIAKIAAGLGLVGQALSIKEAIDKKDMTLAIMRSAHLMVLIGLTFQSCFTGDTEVSTENGLIRIEDIKIGDKVWAYNFETGEIELKEILNVFIKENDKILHVSTSDGETIDTTTNHPFYVEDKGWVAAGDLKIGDVLYTVDCDTVEVTDIEIEKFTEPIVVYNLEVADFHTYFVGECRVMVHNECQLPSKKAALRQAKRDADIPMTQQPERVENVPMREAEYAGGHVIKDESGHIIMTKEYHYRDIYNNEIVIQDHSAGHIKGGQGPHYNVRPGNKTRTGTVPGTKDHYPFRRG